MSVNRDFLIKSVFQKSILVVCLLILLFVLCPSYSQFHKPQKSMEGNNSIISNSNNITSFLSYEDKDIGFKIDYPSSWKIDLESSERYNVVSFGLPDHKGVVDVRIIPQGEYESVKEFGDKEFKESNDYTLLEYYRNKTTLLSDQPAIKAIYLTTYIPSVFESIYGYSSSTSKALFTTTLVSEKKSFYSVAYFSPPATFDHNLPIVEKMIKSFQIIKSLPKIHEED